ncbi:MAG: hypothetical protein J7M14_04520 [Planctomycetes bacterium]|nr:hypothetical protein [Planctomycetota bacterium]
MWDSRRLIDAISHVAQSVEVGVRHVVQRVVLGVLEVTVGVAVEEANQQRIHVTNIPSILLVRVDDLVLADPQHLPVRIVVVIIRHVRIAFHDPLHAPVQTVVSVGYYQRVAAVRPLQWLEPILPVPF